MESQVLEEIKLPCRLRLLAFQTYPFAAPQHVQLRQPAGAREACASARRIDRLAHNGLWWLQEEVFG